MSVPEQRSQLQFLRAAKQFGANKSLGQHFLVDPDALMRVVHALGAVPGDSVLEIGAGLGFLTEMLTDSGASVQAVELDGRCVRYLNDLDLPRTKIVLADILRFKIEPSNWPGVGVNTEQPKGQQKIKVVGNIPYQITAPIIVHLLGEIGSPSPWLKYIDSVVITIQLEVAQRLQARPGSKAYGQISLLVNYFSTAQIIAPISRECFYPPPDVDSAIVKLVPLDKPAIACDNPQLLRTIIKTGFGQRRKMLINNLATNFGIDQCKRVFGQMNIDPQSRAENLSLSQFAKLADWFSNLQNGKRK